MSLTQNDIKTLKVLIKQEAAKMLDDVIAQCYSYNAERRETKGFNGEEIHFRTLELMQRFANREHADELAWIHRHEIENETRLRL